MFASALFILINLTILIFARNSQSNQTFEIKDNVTSAVVNLGKRNGNQRYWYEHSENTEKVYRGKTDLLSRLFKMHIDRLRNQTNEVELIFLVDASGSVGVQNFRNELSFVRKLLSDFTVDSSAARVAVVTFGDKKNVDRIVDQISQHGDDSHKCYLLNKQLYNVSYTGGGTYTLGALLEALEILKSSREAAKKVVFLITDGFSNGGDPRPAAALLKEAGATVFTFGIRTGNVEELQSIASSPGYMHSYLLDSFAEFEALARRALHRDLRTGRYVPVPKSSDCDLLCPESSDEETCCDELATCACGVATGHYACLCPTGYFGSGFKGFCQPCPNGTYASGEISGDSTALCKSCPDVNHVTIKVPATSIKDCVCAMGFITNGNKCEVITCPKLKIPENGYLVKANACSNVVNAACGIRCRIGFHLTGDSIRLCRENGAWSGNEPQCLLKTCPALKAPTYGRMRCEHDEDYQHQIKDDSTAYPIDTRCQFRCELGYQLRGSKVRNCLPLSRWDGLKVTCKAIKCEPLRQVANGEIFPENCTGPEKLPFATNCTIKCKKGFVLEGSRNRFCSGKTGIWSQRHNVNRCIDKVPPFITCPSDMVFQSLPGENYVYVNWTIPEVIDNVDEDPVMWSKPYIIFPWKAKIGTRTIMYVAQDSSGNRARCKFKVKVLDKEPPMIENCIDPPTMYTNINSSIYNIVWDEPGFFDNSGFPVKIEQTHRPGENVFPLGRTEVIYNVTDKYKNSATCILNITIKDICENLPLPSKSHSTCSSTEEHGTECIISCDEDYDFAFQPPNFDSIEGDLLLNCSLSNRTWDDFYIPDCSEILPPKTVAEEGDIILEGNTSAVCDNQTTLRELSEYITDDLRSNLLDICGNDVECNLISFDPECLDDLFLSEFNDSNSVRRKRGSKEQNTEKRKDKKKKKERIEIKFKFIGKIIDENFENPREGIRKLRKKIEAMTRSGKLNLLHNRTNHEIAKLALNLHLLFKEPREICDFGSILKKHNCVKCSSGTFHNASTDRCQPCPFGQFQNLIGSTECKRCPEHTFTKRMHAKSVQDCTPVCQPGYFSRRKRYHKSTLALEPCLACDIGYYQANYGQTECLPCPSNTTTRSRGSTSLYNCFDAEESCLTRPCSNGGECVWVLSEFVCKCPDYYLGSNCETFLHPCTSSPCLNEGVCSVKGNEGNFLNLSYSCTCKNGYTGYNCEIYIDECETNPCQNGGKCISTESDYACECRNGFEGQFCEIVMDHCDPPPCEEGSTCLTINETWQCLCKPGYLGRHCNLLPCDWLPCHANAICVNIQEENATRSNYRCECPNGYTGNDCATRIDYCKSYPCLNNGECVNEILKYSCICPVPFTGRNCEIELPSDYVMHFTKSGTTDYVMMRGPKKDISELTVCLWLQSVDTFNYGTVLSYATPEYDNAFTLTDYNGFVLYVNGQRVVTDVKVNDGNWHFLCITWEGRYGSWEIFIDGILRDNGTDLAKGTSIQGNESLAIGQEQDRVGGGFSESESFLGKLTLLDIWDSVLDDANITHLLNTCEKYYGTLLGWSQVYEHIHGDVVILKSPFCRPCLVPEAPFRGNVIINEDSSEITYYCEPGYIVKFQGKEQRSLRRRCLKQGQWEGYLSKKPICAKIKCGSPGHFPRGRIHGRSYSFGDEIYYSCKEGYELRGNPHRICSSNGNWSGQPPICIGKTCRNLLAPENGDIEYIIEENERDDITIVQVGQQLEFKCDSGFHIVGERYLTCLESGIWDSDEPTCVRHGCSTPKEIEHGYIISKVSNKLNVPLESEINTSDDNLEETYYYGDIVQFACQEGYKFQGNYSLFTEMKLECSTNGSWIGFLSDCIPLECPWPEEIENAKLFLKTEDNDTIEVSAINGTVFNVDNWNNSEEGSEDKFSFIPGTELLITCNHGYELIGSRIVTCTDQEDWLPNLPSCRPRECSVDYPIFRIFDGIKNQTILDTEKNKFNFKFNDLGGSYGNLEYFIEGITYENRITLACRNGSTINTNDFIINETLKNITWICDANGEWETNLLRHRSELKNLLNNTVDTICKSVTCDLPKVPENGYILNDSNANSKNITESIVFKCRSGYLLEGEEKSFCTPNGKWSAVPSCKPVVCGKPPIPANAVIKENSGETGRFIFGNMVTYQCVPGYRIFGQGSVRCLANGKWSRLTGRCSKISCGKPKTQPGVTVHGKSYLYQDQLTYICPNGKKQGLITCKSDGKWSDPPACNGK